MAKKFNYDFSIEEEIALSSYESQLIKKIQNKQFNKKDFLDKYLPYILEGLEISDKGTVYGNGEVAESLLLVDCLMRHQAKSKEDYLKHLQRDEIFENLTILENFSSIEKAEYYQHHKSRDHRYITELYIARRFNLTYPLEKDEKFKKIIERVYDKVLERITLKPDATKETQSFEEKKIAICDDIMCKFINSHRAIGENKKCYDFFNWPIYTKDYVYGILGSLGENNIFIIADAEYKYSAQFYKCIEDAVDDYIKHFIIGLCVKRIFEDHDNNIDSEDTTPEEIIANCKIDEDPDILEKKLNLFNVKKYLKETSPDLILQGIISTAIIIFMKQMAQDDYLEKEKKKLRKEYEINDNMCLVHKDEFENLQKKNTELEQEVNKKQEKILSLTEKYGALPDDIQEENKRIKKENADYRKEIYALKKELEALQAEKEAFQIQAQTEDTIEVFEESEEEIEEDIISVKELPDYIYDKKYIFLCTRDEVAFRLEKKFPNSIVSKDYNIREVNSDTIDAVVCLVRDISHPDYYKFKQKCKNMNIPFIDCNCKNTERIAQEIHEFGIEK